MPLQDQSGAIFNPLAISQGGGAGAADPGIYQQFGNLYSGITVDPKTGKITNISNPYTDSSGHSGIDPNNSNLPVSGDPRRGTLLALQQFKQAGVTPTQQEINQFLPLFNLNDQTGQQALANYLSQKAAPTAQEQYAQQQQKYQSQAGQYSGQIGQMFQSMLGRAPTQDEINHFGSLMASGQTDSYQVGQYLQQTPEYQQSQNSQFLGKLGGQLNDVNSQFFKMAGQDVIGQFAAQGRDVSGASSGLQMALANVAKQLQTQSQQYLAQVGAGMYGQNQQFQQGNYQAQLANQYGIGNLSLQNSLGQQNYGMEQNYGMYDYQTQQNDLRQLMGSYNNKGSWWQPLAQGAISGGATALGAYLGGPAGAAAGNGAGNAASNGLFSNRGSPSSYGSYGQAGGPLSLYGY